MIYLLLSIVSSTIIMLVFKAYDRLEINTFRAIVINYIICVSIGLMVTPSAAGLLKDFWLQPWFPLSLLLGALFIGGFYLLAATVKISGVTVATVAARTSLIIPVIAAYFLYNDDFNAYKVAGIILAVIAVILTSKKKKGLALVADSVWTYILPLGVLIVSGGIESLVKYGQQHLIPDEAFHGFLIFLFGTAAALGILGLAVQYLVLMRKKENYERWRIKDMLGGICLGIPNYGSLIFLILALDHGWESSFVFPLNNLSVVALASLSAFVIFRERLLPVNYLGLTIGLGAIIFLLIGSY